MKKILFVLYEIFIFLPIFALATVLTAVTVMIGCSVSKSNFWRSNPPRYWSKLGCRLALCRINVIHKTPLDPNQSYIFVPNHQSYADIFLVYGYIGQTIKWMQKQELRKIPFVGKASEIAGHVFVDHSSLKSMSESLRKAEEQLTDGASFTIFPEGARTFTGKMGKFKRGAFVIAKDMGLPVVPVTLNGPYDVMRRGSLILHLGKKLEMIVHEPIPTTNLTDEEIPELMNRCREIVHDSLWDKYK